MNDVTLVRPCISTLCRLLLLLSIVLFLENFLWRYPFSLAMTSLFAKQRMQETTVPWVEVDRAEMTAWTFSQAESGSKGDMGSTVTPPHLRSTMIVSLSSSQIIINTLCNTLI